MLAKVYTALVLILFFSANLFAQEGASEYVAKGRKQFGDGAYKEALISFNNAIEDDSLSYLAYFFRGNTKKIFEDYHGAMKDYNMVVDINPAFAGAYYERGNVKFSLQDYYGAIGDFGQAIDLDKNHVQAYYQRGQARRELEAYSDAINDCTKILEIHPRNADALFLRGILRIKHGLLQQGCLDLSKAGELGDLKAYDIIRDVCNRPTH